MKRLLILLLTGLFAQLVVSCYPEGADNIEDYDVAITKLLQKREMRKDIVIELSYKGFSRASDYS